MRIPAVAEIGRNAIMRAAVDELNERPFLLGVELRRVNDPHLHVFVVGTLEVNFLCRAEIPVFDEIIVEAVDARWLLTGADNPDLMRKIERRSKKGATVAVGGDGRRRVRMSLGEIDDLI